MKYYIGLIISVLMPMLLLGQNQIILNHDIRVEIKYVGSNFKIVESHDYSRLITTDRNLGASESISYSSLDNLIDFKAHTKVPNGRSGYKVQKVKTSKIVSQDSRGVFFSGREALIFDYPSAVKNSICNISYKKDIVDPQFLSSFIIAEYYPIESFSFTVVYPNNVDFEMDLRNVDSLNVESTIVEDDGIITKTILIKNIPEYKYVDKLESMLYVYPHILARIKSVNSKGNVIKVSESVSDLYKWYVQLVKRIPESKSQINLKNLVEEITLNIPTDTEKIRTIYKWVQKNIEYIAFEDGMNGFIPRNADRIYEKRYGDCKDMANLLKTMLNHAKIPAYLTWIGTRSKPYSYKTVPSVCTDNHMICAVKIDDEYVFLDATIENINLNVIPQSIQGKEALIGINDTEFDLVEVPITSVNNNSRIDSIVLSVKDKTLSGVLTSELKGYFKNDYDMRALYKSFKKEEGYHLDLLDIGGRDYTTLYASDERSDQDTKITAFTSFSNKIIKAGSKMYVNLSLKDFYGQLQVDDLKNRTVDIHEDYKFNHEVVTTLNIPEGYTLSNIPKNTINNNDLYEFSQTFVQEGETLICKQKMKLDFISLDSEYFESYDQFLQIIKQAEKQKIVLLKS